MDDILTLTLNPCIDKNTSVRQVMAEKKLRCSEPGFHPGGGGLNVTRAIHKLGGKSRALWTSGGAIGGLLEKLLDDEDVSHEPFPIEAMTRENLIVFEEESEQQFRFGMPGARLSEEECDRLIDQVKNLDPAPAYLVLSGSLPPGTGDDFYARLARSAPEGTRVVLDTSGKALRQGLDGPVFLIKPNIAELGALAERDIESDDEIREISRNLIREGRVKVVVTSLGSGGVMAVSADLEERIGAPTVPIRSKVGAGDSTVAGLVLALQRGEPLGKAVRFGVACGAAAVKTPGTELCRREDAEELYENLIRG